MSTIRINNKTYTGNSVTVNNSKIYIDGKLQEQDGADRNISIVVEGNLEKLSADCCDRIEIRGNCGSVTTQSGDVVIDGNVSDSVQTMSGDVMAEDICGNVSTMSGDVKCRSKGQ